MSGRQRERERDPILVLICETPQGGLAANLPFTGAHLLGPLFLPTEELVHISWTGP